LIDDTLTAFGEFEKNGEETDVMSIKDGSVSFKGNRRNDFNKKPNYFFSLTAFSANCLRTLLSLLCVIIGISSVTALYHYLFQINDRIFRLNVVVERLTLLLRIRDVPGSNLGLETGYPD
jgi:hypothetical protein